MVDIAPFGKIIVTHDSTNLLYGANINLEQLELARLVVPIRGVRNRVKTKNRKANIRPRGTHHVLPLAYYGRTMPYLEGFVKFYFEQILAKKGCVKYCVSHVSDELSMSSRL